MEWGLLFREFITLTVVIDPVGTIPVFMATTAAFSASVRRKIAFQSVLIAAGVLFFFLLCGQIVFEALGLELGTFQIAGGIILFLFALTMIFGKSKTEQEIAEVEASHTQSAVFPLAIPSIASPGAMLAVIILTDNHRNSVTEQAITSGLLLVVLLITLLLLLLASPILKVIGVAGASVISRVMGIILSTVAVDSILKGFAALGVIDFTG